MHMRVLVLLSVFVLVACSKPEDIVFGPEPLKQIAEQGDKFRKMTEEDRALLVGYLTVAQIGRAIGGDVKPSTGRTVGEVMADARAWRAKMQEGEAAAKQKEAEAKVLRDRVLAERTQVAQRIAGAVTVAVLDKKVLPENFDVGRYSEMMSLSYAIENKSDKTIRQLKGRVTFKDATGDTVGWLPVDFDESIGAGKTLKTTTGRGWKLNKFMNGEIERIAAREFSSMTVSFEPESIAFEGGEVIKAPALKE